MIVAIDARMYGKSQCSGIGNYLKQLTDNLFALDEENQYLLFLSEPEFARFEAPNKRVRKVLASPRWYSYAEQWKLPFIFAKEKFDLIHYPHFNSPILFPKKSICTIHDITPLYFPGHRMGSLIRRMGYQAVFNATLQKASKIIAVSQSTKAGILNNFKVQPSKVEVVYEGVDESFKKQANYDIISGVKQRFGIIKPFIFFVSVWRSHKNIEGLIEAFNIIREKYHFDCQLVLSGREDLHYTRVRDAIDASAFKNDIITTGFVSEEELSCLYSSASVFAIPSFIEGFGLMALEAQKCDCPVVASNATSLPEVLDKSGVLFDPRNQFEMAQKIHSILIDQNLRESLIVRGQENLKRFSWRQCALKTLQIYKSVR